MTQLSGIAGEIEEVIGLDLAVRLLKARGGTEIAIPARIPGSQLEQLVGREAAARMLGYFGAGKLRLPLGGVRGQAAYNAARKARALGMLRAGRSLREVALGCDLAMSTVSKYRDELATDAASPQGKLDL